MAQGMVRPVVALFLGMFHLLLQILIIILIFLLDVIFRSSFCHESEKKCLQLQGQFTQTYLEATLSSTPTYAVAILHCYGIISSMRTPRGVFFAILKAPR